MKDKIIYRKFKNNYNGYLVIGVWIFFLAWMTVATSNQFEFCSTKFEGQLEGIAILLFFTGIILIIAKYLLKYSKGNYKDIELEGEVK